MTKMVMAVVFRDQAPNVLEALVKAGHTATVSESRGGVLRQAQFTLFMAVEEKDMDKVLSIIQENCRTQVEVGSTETPSAHSLGPISATADLGGAVVFIWDLERFETF